MTFQSTKVYDGFSTVFRQWKAEGTHCRFLHGYGTSVKVVYEGPLDEKNWVFDFGGLKRSKNKINELSPKDWLDWLLDHTVIIAEDDPELQTFYQLDNDGVIQLRVIEATGAERFAEFLFKKLNEFITIETDNRVRVVSVEFIEHDKNSAIYKEDK